MRERQAWLHIKDLAQRVSRFWLLVMAAYLLNLQLQVVLKSPIALVAIADKIKSRKHLYATVIFKVEK